MPERALRALGAERPAGLIAALREAGLPCGDLDEAIFYQLEDGQGPIAWAGLELYGREALLRSVVVPARQRGAGVGSDLVVRVMQAAAAQGVERLWLLTETAAPFFNRLGFRAAPRDEAPAAVRESPEFASVCPASAACMILALPGR